MDSATKGKPPGLLELGKFSLRIKILFRYSHHSKAEGGVMIFIHSYFEFVRLRNFLKSQNASFCLLGEYAKNSDISCARERFFVGSRKIMLYTERAYFYRRYKIRGIKNLTIYSLPERKEFYPQIMNMLEEGSHDMMSTELFSRFDLLQLERIVGSASAKHLCFLLRNNLVAILVILIAQF